MKADAQTAEAVGQALSKMAQAYESRDIDALMACFAPDPDGVMYGTGADEKRVGPAEVRVPARATFVLEHRGGRWLIAQAHFSTPASGQEEGPSF
jgi:ketosteroid isomerase-like protein